MVDKPCFLRWFVLALGYAAGAYFAFRYGLPQELWRADVTHITTIIAVAALASIAYLGLAAWRFDRRGTHWPDEPDYATRAEADIGIGRMAAFLVTLLGLLGTTIGLMLQVKAMGSIDVSNPQNVVAFIAVIGAALSTALYATASGIVACVAITLMTQVLEYQMDLE